MMINIKHHQMKINGTLYCSLESCKYTHNERSILVMNCLLKQFSKPTPPSLDISNRRRSHSCTPNSPHSTAASTPCPQSSILKSQTAQYCKQTSSSLEGMPHHGLEHLPELFFQLGWGRQPINMQVKWQFKALKQMESGLGLGIGDSLGIKEGTGLERIPFTDGSYAKSSLYLGLRSWLIRHIR